MLRGGLGVKASGEALPPALPLTLPPFLSLQVVAGLYEGLREGNGFADKACQRFGAGAVPPWLTPQELWELGIAVDLDFEDESPPTTVYETVEGFFNRVRRTMESIKYE